MNKKSRLYKLSVMLLCAVFLSACTGNTTPPGQTAQEQETTVSEGASIISYTGSTEEELKQYGDLQSDNTNQIELTGFGASVKGSGAEAKGSTVTITQPGVYAISGKLEDGQIIVDVADKGYVGLILNSAEINSSTSAPIYVKNAGKTIITLQQGTENLISDGKEYVYPDSATDEPNSAIFSKDNLVISGTGKLTVRGNFNNGITSKDDLEIVSGNINVFAADDALMGRDFAALRGGDITIQAGGDGIKASNDTDKSLGAVIIEGGTFNINSTKDAIKSSNNVTITGGEIVISSEDDGIHADSSIAISGGRIDIAKSYEGIESAVIDVSGGEIHVVSSDDGVNVAGGNDGSAVNGRPGQGNFNTSSNNKLNISGGYMTVDAAGDGLDANGSIYMAGGTVVVSGPTANNNGALDYDGVFDMSGGLIVAAGSSGMAQAPSEESKQSSVLMYYSQLQKAGTIVHLKDDKGNTIVTFAPAKDYQSIVISSPQLANGSNYSLYTAGTSTGSNTDGLYTDGQYKEGTKVVDFTISKAVTYMSETGETTARSFGPGGGKGPGMGGGFRDPAAGGDPNRPVREKPAAN